MSSIVTRRLVCKGFFRSPSLDPTDASNSGTDTGIDYGDSMTVGFRCQEPSRPDFREGSWHEAEQLRLLRGEAQSAPGQVDPQHPDRQPVADADDFGGVAHEPVRQLR